MPVTTVQALLVVAVFVLPGALFEWAYERVGGAWNVDLSDRVIRFVGTSALLHALAFPASFAMWMFVIRPGPPEGRGVLAGAGWVCLMWISLLAGVAAPTLLGATLGRHTKEERGYVRHLVGQTPAPRAWDHLFHRDVAGWVRIKLKSGPFVAGLFSRDSPDPERRSYAAGFPNPTDIYLSYRVEVDAETGDFKRGDDGNLVRIDSGLLIRQEDIEVLEFFPG